MTKLSAQQRLRRRREALGLSRRAAAELAGVSQSRIWASEQTKITPDPVSLKKIAEAYNKKAEEMGALPPIEI